MTLNNELNESRQKISTDTYPMSIGEWSTMYKDGELDIHPEFQRFYRWTAEQKTNLIESILLGIPIPPIFVSQRSDGVWDVIDGLQRLSTIFEFMGILKGEHGETVAPLILTKTEMLPSLQDVTWNAPEGSEEDAIEQSRQLQLLIKRSKINASIILKESGPTIKYELFQRLNTGGTTLSDQEVRNCILIMLNRDMFIWLKELSNNQSFQNVISLSDNIISQQYDMDLALRFIIFHDISEDALRGLGDVNLFITNRMKEMATTNFNKETLSRRFTETFTRLEAALDGEYLRRYNGTKFIGGFILSAFEAIALGIGYNIAHDTLDINLDKIKQVFSNADFTAGSGAGVSAKSRLPRLIPLGRRVFSREN